MQRDVEIARPTREHGADPGNTSVHPSARPSVRLALGGTYLLRLAAGPASSPSSPLSFFLFLIFYVFLGYLLQLWPKEYGITIWDKVSDTEIAVYWEPIGNVENIPSHHWDFIFFNNAVFSAWIPNIPNIFLTLGKRYGIGVMLLESYWELGEQIRNSINSHWEWQPICNHLEKRAIQIKTHLINLFSKFSGGPVFFFFFSKVLMELKSSIRWFSIIFFLQ